MNKLLCTPNFDGLPSLQSFVLNSCEELEEIHPSLGNHTSLEEVQVRECHKLRMFPTIVRMSKLNTLKLLNCNAIQQFPGIQANLENLEKLSVELKGITVLPSSIGVHCTYLRSLILVKCWGLNSIEFSFSDFKHLETFHLNKKIPLILLETGLTQLSRNLKYLKLDGCGLKDGEIPHDVVELSHLQELDLSYNYFTRLNLDLLQLTCLKVLKLNNCEQLVELPKLPSSLVILEACCCDSLTTVGDCYTNCEWLSQVSLKRGGVVIDANRMLKAMLLQGNAVENKTMILKVEGCELAKVFRPALVRGRRCRLELPENWCNDYSGFLLCSVFMVDYRSRFQEILIRKKEMRSGDEAQEKIWEWEKPDKRTMVWYVPFASFRDSTWWKHTSQTTAFFSIKMSDPMIFGQCTAFGVGLVTRKIQAVRQQHKKMKNHLSFLVMMYQNSEFCTTPNML